MGRFLEDEITILTEEEETVAEQLQIIEFESEPESVVNL